MTPDLELSAEERNALQEAVSRELQQTRERLQAAGVKVEEVLQQHGVPFVCILEEARNRQVNATVIGSGEHRTDERYALGITAEKVMQKSTSPVWVAKRGAAFDPERILCPVDLSPASGRALRNAIHLARNFGAALQVVHVVPGFSSLLQKLLPVDPDRQQERMQSRFLPAGRGLAVRAFRHSGSHSPGARRNANL